MTLTSQSPFSGSITDDAAFDRICSEMELSSQDAVTVLGFRCDRISAGCWMSRRDDVVVHVQTSASPTGGYVVTMYVVDDQYSERAPHAQGRGETIEIAAERANAKWAQLQKRFSAASAKVSAQRGGLSLREMHEMVDFLADKAVAAGADKTSAIERMRDAVQVLYLAGVTLCALLFVGCADVGAATQELGVEPTAPAYAATCESYCQISDELGCAADDCLAHCEYTTATDDEAGCATERDAWLDCLEAHACEPDRVQTCDAERDARELCGLGGGS